jgi:hypothetical protein
LGNSRLDATRLAQLEEQRYEGGACLQDDRFDRASGTADDIAGPAAANARHFRIPIGKQNCGALAAS